MTESGQSPSSNELISRLCTLWKWLDLSDCSVDQKYDPVMAKWHYTGINHFWFELTWSQSLQETLLAVMTFITQGCFAAERVSPYLVLCRYVAHTFRLGLKCSVLFGETDDLKRLSCLCKSFGSHQRSHINVISSGIPAAGRWINETVNMLCLGAASLTSSSWFPDRRRERSSDHIPAEWCERCLICRQIMSLWRQTDAQISDEASDKLHTDSSVVTVITVTHNKPLTGLFTLLL